MRDLQVVSAECRSCAAVGAQGEQFANVHGGPPEALGRPDHRLHGQRPDHAQRGPRGRPLLHAHRGRARGARWPSSATTSRTSSFRASTRSAARCYVHGYPLRVIGLQSKLGNVLGQNRDKVVFVPLSFLQKVMTSDDGIAILVRPLGGMKGLAGDGRARSGRILRSLRQDAVHGRRSRSAWSAPKPSSRSGARSPRGPSRS